MTERLGTAGGTMEVREGGAKGADEELSVSVAAAVEDKLWPPREAVRPGVYQIRIDISEQFREIRNDVDIVQVRRWRLFGGVVHRREDIAQVLIDAPEVKAAVAEAPTESFNVPG